MRDLKDKKLRSTSIRFTEEQLSKAKNMAQENNMTVSSLIGYLIDKESVSITPQVMTTVQNIVNKAVEVVAERSVSDAENMQKEVDELWQLLK